MTIKHTAPRFEKNIYSQKQDQTHKNLAELKGKHTMLFRFREKKPHVALKVIEMRKQNENRDRQARVETRDHDR